MEQPTPKPKDRRPALGEPLMHVPWGLCGNRSDHEPHLCIGSPVGDFFCTARQQDRLPYSRERKRDALG
jgi:hypothetical protein